MCDSIEDMKQLENKFKSCKKVLTAIGDEVRQHLLCIMLECECNGSRVIDIAAKTNLSRPAVSYHIQILKNAGIVKSRKEGTCIYYYFDPDINEIRNLIELLTNVGYIMEMFRIGVGNKHDFVFYWHRK